MEKKLFTVSNHHIIECGEAPKLNGDEKGKYYGYFENGFGEQWILVSDKDKKEAYVFCGDAGWGKKYPVVNGGVDLIMDECEKSWVKACYKAAGLSGCVCC